MYEDCKVRCHMTPLKTLYIDVNIVDSSVIVIVKHFTQDHMTPTQAHDTGLSQRGNTEVYRYVPVKELC